jgi:multiple sugar transport system substrate-binding protein
VDSPPPRASAAVPARRGILRGAASPALAAPALAAFGGTRAVAAAGARAATAPPSGLEGVALQVLCNTPHLSMYKNVLAPAWQQLTGGTLTATAVD